MATDDGGNAFPALENVQQYDDDRGTYVDSYQPMGGMRLRDYFAAKALAGGIAEFFRAGETWDDYDDFAQSLYRIADAMLKERSK